MLFDRFLEVMKHHRWMGKKIVMGVSGGLDSMVMAQLLVQSGCTVVAAHCNYGLRAAASDADEALVRDWCKVHQIPVKAKSFPLQSILARDGGNLQEQARILRYRWFEEIRCQLGFDLVAVAHHEGDALETLLLNFFKGTGISGLHGILPQQGRVVRPLLSFSKEQLAAYAELHGIPWRTDESNHTNHYLRNKIRNQLLPLLTEMFPNLRGNLAGNIERLGEAESLYQEAIDRYRKKLLLPRGTDWYLPVLKLRNCSPLPTIFYELLKPFGFSSRQLPDLLRLLDAESGKFVNSATHRIVRDRSSLIITLLPTRKSNFILIDRLPPYESIDCPGFVLHKSIRENLEGQAFLSAGRLHPANAFIDLRNLQFPLICRPWRQGDYFYPLGLGKKKKVSRFLIDQKVSLPEKEKVWVLESQKKIVWVIGRRLDDRFKITASTKDILYFTIS